MGNHVSAVIYQWLSVLIAFAQLYEVKIIRIPLRPASTANAIQFGLKRGGLGYTRAMHG